MRILGKLPHIVQLTTSILSIALLLALWSLEVTLADIQPAMQSMGPAGWGLFIGLFGLMSASFVPTLLLIGIGVILYGPILGSILSVLGLGAGSYIGYRAADWFAKDAYQKILKKRMRKLQNKIAHRGIETVILLRLIPIMPTTQLHYGLGHTTLKRKHVIIGTIIGSIPYVSIAGLGSWLIFAFVLGGSGNMLSAAGGLTMLLFLLVSPWLYARLRLREHNT